MRYAIIFSLLASGSVFAHHRDNNQTTTKLSGREVVALETSSPRVHVGKMRKHRENSEMQQYNVVADKTTINAFVPVGK